MRPHQCCCLPAAEKTYCSAALISSPRAAFFLLHHAHQHAHRPLGAQLFGILQVSIGYCFLPFGASFEVYGLCSCLRTLLSRCLDPCSPSVVIPDIHKGDRFPKAAVRTLVRNRSRFSGGSSVWSGTRVLF